VTGRAAREVIDTDLLAPLGLNHTGWEPEEGAAVGYRQDPYQDTVHVEPVMDRERWASAASCGALSMTC
jgi:CubicO group peptidase (beta-lactamase class C family)